MNIKAIIKRYTSNQKIKEGYYLRIRKEKETVNIKVYYHGIKMMEWNNENLLINTSILVPNESNVFEEKKLIERYRKIPTAVEKDMKQIEPYFDFFIGNKGEKGNKINICFSSGTLRHTEEELMNTVITHLKKYQIDSYFSDIKIINHKIWLFLLNAKYSFLELYYFMIPLLEVTIENKELQKVEMEIKSKLKKEITDFDELEKVLKNRIDVYRKEDHNRLDDYKNSKSETNQEKQKQQDFMILFNQENKKDIFYQTKEGKRALLYSKNTVPFELEYTIYAGKKSKNKMRRTRSNIKGRIDNIVLDGDILHLTEMKYGTGVITGNNGIHKHLIDLYSCLTISKEDIFRELEERIEIRNEILKGQKQTVNLSETFYYDIICVYEKKTKEQTLSKDAVIKKIHEINKKNILDKKVIKCNIEDHKITDITASQNKNPNQYAKELLTKNIEELCELLKLEGCITRILLVDDEWKAFEEC